MVASDLALDYNRQGTNSVYYCFQMSHSKIGYLSNRQFSSWQDYADIIRRRRFLFIATGEFFSVNQDQTYRRFCVSVSLCVCCIFECPAASGTQKSAGNNTVISFTLYTHCKQSRICRSRIFMFTSLLLRVKTPNITTLIKIYPLISTGPALRCLALKTQFFIA